ncbi:MAG: biotin--[acetyl-CoA-carboxylase] ligase [Anaerolineales bacterium]|nr:biotin--[acetyl-CoA-carboxylase] ligase [Anaerolineales bacterium]
MSTFPTQVERHATIGSTMDRARALAEAGAPEGTLVLADEQTAGRGTAGRRWLTPPGTQLAFSLIVRPPLSSANLPRLTMWVGLALHAAARRFVLQPTEVALKWPNDLLIAGRKTAGILVEGAFELGRIRYAILGVGLNVSTAPPDDQVEFPATCLATHTAAPVDQEALLQAVLQAMAVDYPARLFSPELVAQWRAALWWPDGPMSVQVGTERLVGHLSAITETGALVLDTDTGPRTLETGRLRPAAPGPYNGPEGGPRDV